MTINRFAADCAAEIRRNIRSWLLLTGPAPLLLGGLFFMEVSYPLLSNYLFISYLGVNSTPVYYAWIAWALAIGSGVLVTVVTFSIPMLIITMRNVAGRRYV